MATKMDADVEAVKSQIEMDFIVKKQPTKEDAKEKKQPAKVDAKEKKQPTKEDVKMKKQQLETDTVKKPRKKNDVEVKKQRISAEPAPESTRNVFVDKCEIALGFVVFILQIFLIHSGNEKHPLFASVTGLWLGPVLFMTGLSGVLVSIYPSLKMYVICFVLKLTNLITCCAAVGGYIKTYSSAYLGVLDYPIPGFLVIFSNLCAVSGIVFSVFDLLQLCQHGRQHDWCSIMLDYMINLLA